MKKMVILLLLTPFTLVLSSCGPKNPVSQKVDEEIAEKAIENATGGKADVDLNSETVTVKTDEGTSQYSAEGEAKLPESFPLEFMVVNDAKIMVSSTAENATTVAYITNSEQSAVFEKYKTELQSKGWVKEMELDAGTGKMTTFAKDTIKASVTVGENTNTEQTEKTMVYVVITQE